MKPKLLTSFAVLPALFCILNVSPAAAEDWPGWRGANGSGISSEKNLPVEWGKEKNIRWRIEVPGYGASSPIVVGDRIYLTTQTEDSGYHVLALDRETGRTAWQKKIGQGKLKTHELHNMATPTPVSDGQHVWALFGTGDLVCLDRAGEAVWRRNLQESHGEYKIQWGMGTSPRWHNGKLFVACMQQGPSYFLALDSKTGRDLWKRSRDLGPNDEARDSYSSPILIESKAGVQLVLAGANHINAYDPQTGDQIWISGGLEVSHPYGRTIAGPAAGEGIVLAVASGFQNRGRMLAFKADGQGDISDSHKIWEAPRYTPDCPTPLVYQGLVYLIRDDGIASCLDAKTGDAHWQERLFTANVKVSPVAGDGKVYFLSGQGNAAVLKAGSKLEILAQNNLEEETIATPAISHGTLFVRTRQHLYAVR